MIRVELWELEEAERTAHNEFLRKACTLARETDAYRMRVKTYRKRLSGQARAQTALRARIAALEDAIKEMYGELEEASPGSADPTIVACQKIARRVLF